MKHIIRERGSLLKAILTSILLVVLTTGLLYPNMFWYIPIFGGLISIIGILLKRKVLITFGMVLIGALFFLNNLTVSPSNIILLIGLFVLLYGAIIYLIDLVRMDMMWRNSKGDTGDTFRRYRKNWNRSIIKRLSFVFLLSILTSIMISWTASFEFWGRMGNNVLLGVSALFTLAILFFLYVLFIKLPTLYGPGE